jgi:hypothetical protein
MLSHRNSLRLHSKSLIQNYCLSQLRGKEARSKVLFDVWDVFHSVGPHIQEILTKRFLENPVDHITSTPVMWRRKGLRKRPGMLPSGSYFLQTWSQGHVNAHYVKGPKPEPLEPRKLVLPLSRHTNVLSVRGNNQNAQ